MGEREPTSLCLQSQISSGAVSLGVVLYIEWPETRSLMCIPVHHIEFNAPYLGLLVADFAA